MVRWWEWEEKQKDIRVGTKIRTSLIFYLTSSLFLFFSSVGDFSRPSEVADGGGREAEGRPAQREEAGRAIGRSVPSEAGLDREVHRDVVVGLRAADLVPPPRAKGSHCSGGLFSVFSAFLIRRFKTLLAPAFRIFYSFRTDLRCCYGVGWCTRVASTKEVLKIFTCTIILGDASPLTAPKAKIGACLSLTVRRPSDMVALDQTLPLLLLEKYHVPNPC